MIDYKELGLKDINNIYDIGNRLSSKFPWLILKHLSDKNVNLDKLFEELSENNINIEFNLVANSLINLNKQELIIKYLDYFFKNNQELLEFKKIVRDIEIVKDKIDNYINNNPDCVISEITRKNIKFLKKEKLYDFFKILIKELLNNEQKKYGDIEYLGNGAYSRVYGIGTKVFKIGVDRNTFKIKNNKRFLKPLYRTIIKSGFKNICIEITERIDTSNITEEDVYKIYKELRDEGILWLDAKQDNLGRLIRDNKIYFDNIDFVDKKSTGYINDNFEILPKGSLVLVDADNLYEADKYFKEHDYNLFIRINPNESRYIKEKENQKNKGVL